MIALLPNRLFIVQGDITTMEVDAIVNAANETLLGGGGVDGAIHRAGGPAILEECRNIGRCKTGDAVITSGGKLPAQYVIHTVGPIWIDGKHGEDELLVSCYKRSLEVARENQILSIAFPCISTGVYSFPQELSVNLVVPFLLSYCKEFTKPQKIILVCYSQVMFDLYQSQSGGFSDESK